MVNDPDRFYYGAAEPVFVEESRPLDNPQDALHELTEAVDELRVRVSPADREVIDASMRTVERGAEPEPRAFRQALGQLAGVAVMVGEVGVPVVEAVRKVMAAFAL